MPLEDSYSELLKSKIADLSNMASSRYGGSITAALFLKEFIDSEARELTGCYVNVNVMHVLLAVVLSATGN